MRPLLEHLEAINNLLPALHNGFFVESYDGNVDRLVILGSGDITYHRDLLIACTFPVEVRFVPRFAADAIRVSKHKSGNSLVDFLDDGSVELFIRGGFLEFECEHI